MKWAGVVSLVVLLALVFVTYASVISTRPFEPDNLYILAWADAAHPADLLRADPAVYPEWRPLAYLTVWLQYRLATIDHLWAYYVVNLLLWAAGGWLIFRIVQVLSGSVVAGLVAAAVLLTSRELIDSVVLIVERQSSLAALFGLTAWLAITRIEDRQPTRLEWVGISLLLAASATSKEYGLAFAAGMAAYALYHRRTHVATAAIAGAVIYAGLRIALAGGALAPFCEAQGFFFREYDLCFDRLDASTGIQALYNVAATGASSLLPGLFYSEGSIRIWPQWLLLMTSALWLVIAVTGWVKGPKPVRMGLLVIAFNAMQSFLVFRSRNQVIALCAVSIAAGAGLPIVWSALGRLPSAPLMRVLAAALLLFLLSLRVMDLREILPDIVRSSSQPDACAEGVRNLDRTFMRRVWQNYRMQLPDCTGVDRRE